MQESACNISVITPHFVECENKVSSGFFEIENSDSKSSSIIYRLLVLTQRKYSWRLEAVAVTPLGKLRYGVVWRTLADVPARAALSMPSAERGSGS